MGQRLQAGLGSWVYCNPASSEVSTLEGVDSGAPYFTTDFGGETHRYFVVAETCDAWKKGMRSVEQYKSYLERLYCPNQSCAW